MASVYIVLMTIPLLTPTLVVGYLWTALTLRNAGPLAEILGLLGLTLNMNNRIVVWLVLAAMDAWHWTSLVVLLCYAGLRAIPDDYYRAARIDGASGWAVFRYIQLPKLRVVLLVAVLLRFMDSFIIYTEPYVVTRGGPGVFDDVPVARAGPQSLGRIQSRRRRRHGDRVFPDRAVRIVGVLHPRGFEARRASRYGRLMTGKASFTPVIYVAFIVTPIYWLFVMSLKTTREIETSFIPYPQAPTLENFELIFSDHAWYLGYLNAVIYVLINVAISVTVAIPAAYAFSRYRFFGDRLLFFAFLIFRMMAPAILLVPFVQIFSEFNLIDTHIAVAIAHCFFNVPIAVWILEGFISIPREVDESARLDGYSLIGFFWKILLPLIAPGVAVTAFFCFMFSWIEALLANGLTVVDAKPINGIMTRAGSVLAGDMPLLAAAGVLAADSRPRASRLHEEPPGARLLDGSSRVIAHSRRERSRARLSATR